MKVTFYNPVLITRTVGNQFFHHQKGATVIVPWQDGKDNWSDRVIQVSTNRGIQFRQELSE